MEGLKRGMQLDALEFNYGYHGNLFEDELSVAKKKEKKKILDKVTKAALAIEEIERGKIYEDAFEWRFEFPEVLDEEGNFVGFDVVIGNPPYIIAHAGLIRTLCRLVCGHPAVLLSHTSPISIRTVLTKNGWVSECRTAGILLVEKSLKI
jgi:hypothetical protein